MNENLTKPLAPVFSKDDGWYFADEQGQEIGSWESKEKAEQMQKYHFKFNSDLDVVTRTEKSY